MGAEGVLALQPLWDALLLANGIGALAIEEMPDDASFVRFPAMIAQHKPQKLVVDQMPGA